MKSTTLTLIISILVIIPLVFVVATAKPLYHEELKQVYGGCNTRDYLVADQSTGGWKCGTINTDVNIGHLSTDQEIVDQLNAEHKPVEVIQDGIKGTCLEFGIYKNNSTIYCSKFFEGSTYVIIDLTNARISYSEVIHVQEGNVTVTNSTGVPFHHNFDIGVNGVKTK